MPSGTIIAISSPPGAGQRAVLRLSGPESRLLVLGRFSADSPIGASRGVYAGRLDDGFGAMPCLWFWMPGPHSFTREDVCELHIPGSPPMVETALECLVRDGARLAQPGEFTRRAFENGRIDLTEAEGVLGLIEAADMAAARSATQLLMGGLSNRIAELRTGLENLRALAEASLDFDSTETGHVETQALQDQADQIGAALGQALTWEGRRRAALGRPRLVLAGRPNAGKSSLFNVLIEGGEIQRALVSDMAGSTRDGKSGNWLVGGVEVELLDAPGFEFQVQAATEDDPDQKAQELAEQSRRGADIIIWCLSADQLREDAQQLIADQVHLPADSVVIVVVTKTDLGPWDRAGLPERVAQVVEISTAADQVGAELALQSAVARALGLEADASGGDARVQSAASLGRELSIRHRAALARGLEALDDARGALVAGIPLDLIAETLRGATDELDAICGQTTPEDLLDRIFAGFCLGK